MDDVDVLAVDEDTVNERYIPPFDTGILLAEAYFHAIEGAFQFLMREQFLDALARFPRQKVQPSWRERSFLALTNIVWAIGSKWLDMAQLCHPEYADTHVVYYARARALGLDHRIIADHPDVERVQGIGLLALYLMLNGSIAR
jgi:hypothetical protein